MPPWSERTGQSVEGHSPRVAQDSTFHQLRIPISEIHRMETHSGQVGGDEQDSQLVPRVEAEGCGKGKRPSMGSRNDQEFGWGRIKKGPPVFRLFPKLSLSSHGFTVSRAPRAVSCARLQDALLQTI